MGLLYWCGNEAPHPEHARGVCPGRPHPGEQSSAEQVLAWLRGTKDDDEALRRLRALMENADAGQNCWQQNHPGQIETLERALTERRQEAPDGPADQQ